MPIDTTTTNLVGADFSQRLDKAALRGQKLAYHRLMRANLSTLDLTGADFKGSDLTGAILKDAILDGADFKDAIITLDQIEQAKSYKDAIAPNGVVIQSIEQIREEYAKGTIENTLDLEARLKLATEREAEHMKQLADMQAKQAEQEKLIESLRSEQRLKPKEGGK